MTKLKGAHLFKVGFFAQMARFNNRTTGNDNGSITTQNYTTVTGNDWADLLLGYTSNYSQSSDNIEAAMEAHRFDFYAQDTWKLNTRITLNCGPRVDHIGWWFDRGGHIAVFNPAAYVATSHYTDYRGLESHLTNPSRAALRFQAAGLPVDALSGPCVRSLRKRQDRNSRWIRDQLLQRSRDQRLFRDHGAAEFQGR
jgi:outer membrane receptor protein involved in Fe transport